jgi:hypothetical protein
MDNQSVGNVDPFSNSPLMKIPNFFPKEINHYTPINHCGTSPSLKGAPSPIYDYFDVSQKYLMNNEKSSHKNIHSLFGGKSSEESTPNNEMSLNQQTPNYDNNFFNMTGVSPVNTQNNFVNQEINEYLQTKKHLLTYNYNSELNKNEIQEVNEGFQEIQNNIDDNNVIVNNMQNNQIQMNDYNNNNFNNKMYNNNNYNNNINSNNEIKYNPINYNTTRKTKFIPQNNNTNQLHQQYPQFDNSNLSLNNNCINSEYKSQPHNINPNQRLNNNNPTNSTMYYPQSNFPINKPNSIQPNNNYHQEFQNTQQMQLNTNNINNNNNNMNQNICMNVDTFQNISISNLNPECYIFERFGKKGWQCEKCKNFNFECKYFHFYGLFSSNHL